MLVKISDALFLDADSILSIEHSSELGIRRENGYTHVLKDMQHEYTLTMKNGGELTLSKETFEYLTHDAEARRKEYADNKNTND